MKPLFQSKAINLVVSILLVVLILVAITIMVIDLMPLLKDVVAHITNEQVVTRDIYDYGWKGIFILAMLQAVQVITTIFPAQPVQILAGLTYGLVKGMAICIVGLVVGNALVFILIRRFGKTFKMFRLFQNRIPKPKKWDLSFLMESRNAAKIAFVLYLIPGLPNGILPYIFAKSKMSLIQFLLIIILAGVPSILFYSLVGERLSSGDTTTSVILLSVLVLLTVLVIVFRKKILDLAKKHS